MVYLFDTVAQTTLLNRICQKLWIYHDFFSPYRKTVEKMVVSSSTGVPKVKKGVSTRLVRLWIGLGKLEAIEPGRLEFRLGFKPSAQVHPDADGGLAD